MKNPSICAPIIWTQSGHLVIVVADRSSSMWEGGNKGKSTKEATKREGQD